MPTSGLRGVEESPALRRRIESERFLGVLFLRDCLIEIEPSTRPRNGTSVTQVQSSGGNTALASRIQTAQAGSFTTRQNHSIAKISRIRMLCLFLRNLELIKSHYHELKFQNQPRKCTSSSTH